VAAGCRAQRRGWKRRDGEAHTGCVSLPPWKVGLCDGHTPCGGNSPLSMK